MAPALGREPDRPVSDAHRGHLLARGGHPAGSDRLGLLKGNNGIGEEIWKDGRIVALSDWELAAIGDPSLDWAFSQGLLTLHDMEDTLDHYAGHSGFAIDRELLAWAAVWIRVKASMSTNSGLAGFLDGRDNRLLAGTGHRIVKPTELDRRLIDRDRRPTRADYSRRSATRTSTESTDDRPLAATSSWLRRRLAHSHRPDGGRQPWASSYLRSIDTVLAT